MRILPLYFFTKTPENQRIAYDNDGIHRYAGLHGQLEYSDDKVSTFVGGSVSRTQYVRVDRMNYAGVENGGQDPTSEKVNITGHNLKVMDLTLIFQMLVMYT